VGGVSGEGGGTAVGGGGGAKTELSPGSRSKGKSSSSSSQRGPQAAVHIAQPTQSASVCGRVVLSVTQAAAAAAHYIAIQKVCVWFRLVVYFLQVLDAFFRFVRFDKYEEDFVLQIKITPTLGIEETPTLCVFC